MPPGRGLVEVFWRRLAGGKKPPPDKKAIAELLQQRSTAYIRNASTHATANVVVESAAATGRLVKAVTDVFSTLVHAPGVQPSLVQTSRRSAHGAARSALASVSRTPFTFARSAHSSIRPRALPKSQLNSVGLQTARNFSSSRPVFENIIANAPLGLRALGSSLDVSELKRKELASNKRRRLEEEQSQHKKMKRWARDVSAATASQNIPAGLTEYFPAVVERRAAAVASAQLVLPLSVSQAASVSIVADSRCVIEHEQDASDAHRMLDDEFMSQLWQLDDSMRLHNHRVRGILDKLRSAGCFDHESGRSPATAEIRPDYQGGLELVLTFYSPRWEVVDIKQIIGHWSDSSAWHTLVDLQRSPSTRSISSTSLSSFDFSPSDSPLKHTPSVQSAEEGQVAEDEQSLEEVQSAASECLQQLRFPAPDLDVRSVHSNDSYVWGVHDFLRTIDHGDRPRF